MIPKFTFTVTDGLDSSFIPNREDDKSTGWDVKCAERDGVTFFPGEMKMISLGFRVFAPDGWWLSIYPRSSSFVKKNLHALYGVVDETYEGNVMFAARYFKKGAGLHISFGERIGQIIPVRRQEMEVSEVSNEEYDVLCKNRAGSRRVGGFGSTGDK